MTRQSNQPITNQLRHVRYQKTHTYLGLPIPSFAISVLLLFQSPDLLHLVVPTQKKHALDAARIEMSKKSDYPPTCMQVFGAQTARGIETRDKRLGPQTAWLETCNCLKRSCPCGKAATAVATMETHTQVTATKKKTTSTGRGKHSPKGRFGVVSAGCLSSCLLVEGIPGAVLHKAVPCTMNATPPRFWTVKLLSPLAAVAPPRSPQQAIGANHV